MPNSYLIVVDMQGASQRPSDLRLSNQYKLFQVALLNAS